MAVPWGSSPRHGHSLKKQETKNMTDLKQAGKRKREETRANATSMAWTMGGIVFNLWGWDKRQEVHDECGNKNYGMNRAGTCFFHLGNKHLAYIGCFTSCGIAWGSFRHDCMADKELETWYHEGGSESDDEGSPSNDLCAGLMRSGYYYLASVETVPTECVQELAKRRKDSVRDEPDMELVGAYCVGMLKKMWHASLTAPESTPVPVCTSPAAVCKQREAELTDMKRIAKETSETLTQCQQRLIELARTVSSCKQVIATHSFAKE